jgi:hypothetical protein
MRNYSLTLILLIASFWVVACSVNPATVTSTSTNVVTEAIAPITETTAPVVMEAENIFLFDEMQFRIGFNYPAGFNQNISNGVVALQTEVAPYELPYPQHARILFTAYTGGVEDNTVAGIRVFRMTEIDALEAGVSENIVAVLEGQIDHRSDFPRLAGAGSPDGQLAIVNFQNGTGYRYVIGTRGFAATSLRSTYATYMYQGFSNDGKYLVSVLIPINLPFLADLLNQELTTSEEAEIYFTKVDERVNAASPTDFEPPLNTLDEMIASLFVTEK